MTKVIAFIPARAGSKRLPNKNKRILLGKPLICWTIEQALECEFIDEVVVSTDDLDIIKLLSKSWSFNDERLCLDVRPKDLAQDDTPIEDVLLNYFKGSNPQDIIILLQPTSPLRNAQDIQEAYKIFTTKTSGNVISGDMGDKQIIINGAIYIFSYLNLCNSKNIFNVSFLSIYFMPKERSIDIDYVEDFNKCEEYLKNGKKRNRN